MHDLPDTDDADADAERFWPEAYKEIIREHLSKAFSEQLQETNAFSAVYEKVYKDRFRHYEEFVERLAEMVVIGSENGIDGILEEIYAVFRRNIPIPSKRLYGRYYWPEPFSEDLKKELHQRIIDEFQNHHAYVHIHEDHYESELSFDEFLDQVADLVISGAVNGADDTIGNIYRSFLSSSPIPTIRRRPRRIR